MKWIKWDSPKPKGWYHVKFGDKPEQIGIACYDPENKAQQTDHITHYLDESPSAPVEQEGMTDEQWEELAEFFIQAKDISTIYKHLKKNFIITKR